MKNYLRLVTVLLVVWFIAAAFASSLQLFRNNANQVGIAVAIAALTPLLLFSLWFAFSPQFRQFTMSLDPATLTSAQAWRMIGFIFVLLQARGVLPAIFAWPAGYGDMAIGATAAFVAWRWATPAHRNSFIFWQVLGIFDLVSAVTLGTTARLLSPHDATMAAMTVLPLSLVPTFLVPLFTIIHFICIAQARQWKAGFQPTRLAAGSAQHAAI